jgi:curved DNA-binding protein CbpA
MTNWRDSLYLPQSQKSRLVLVNVHPTRKMLFANTETALVSVARDTRVIADVNGYYRFLGIDPHATDAEIRFRARELAKELHPDCGGNVEDFLFLQKTLEILLDSQKRAGYDEVSSEGAFLSDTDMMDKIRQERIRGDTRPDLDILSALGVKAMFEKAREEEDQFPYPFYYETPALSIPESDLKLLEVWHDMLFRSALLCGWKDSLRVGMRRNMEKRFEVERREYGNLSYKVFVLKSGVLPDWRMSNMAMAYAAADGDMSQLLTKLSQIEQETRNG